MYEPGVLEIGPVAVLNERGVMTRDTKPGAFLPHSCEEWIIGGPEQIRALIHDLQAALLTLNFPHALVEKG